MEYVYLICLLVAIGMMVWLKLYDVRNSVSQYLSLTTIIISCFGYYFLEISRTLEEALFAQIITYVGGVFLPIFYFFYSFRNLSFGNKESLKSLPCIMSVLCVWICMYNW